jgi:hypothetical protein
MIYLPKRKTLLSPSDCMRACQFSGCGCGVARSQPLAAPPSKPDLSALGLTLELIPDAATWLFTGADMYQWSDQSALTHHFPAAAGHRPQPSPTVADATTKRLFVPLNYAENDRFYCAANLDTFIVADAFTMWVVFNCAAAHETSNAPYPDGIFSNDWGTWGVHVSNIGGTTPTLQCFNNGGAARIDNALSLGVWHCIEFRHAGGKIYTTLDSGAESAGTTSGDTTHIAGSPLRMGADYSNAKSFDGAISYAAICNTDVAVGVRASQRSWLRYYFNSAW